MVDTAIEPFPDPPGNPARGVDGALSYPKAVCLQRGVSEESWVAPGLRAFQRRLKLSTPRHDRKVCSRDQK